MTRDELLEHMARCVHEHCSLEDELLVAEMLLTEPARMLALLNAAPVKWFAPAEFAAHALRCAKRVNAGPTA
jgi:hypothetical protein